MDSAYSGKGRQKKNTRYLEFHSLKFKNILVISIHAGFSCNRFHPVTPLGIDSLNAGQMIVDSKGLATLLSFQRSFDLVVAVLITALQVDTGH